MPQAGAALALKVIAVLYGYTLFMASANVANCERVKPLQCGDQWTLAFSVASGAITTLWGFLTDIPGKNTPSNLPLPPASEPLPPGRPMRPRSGNPMPRP